jgi:hypothetical protein
MTTWRDDAALGRTVEQTRGLHRQILDRPPLATSPP